MKIILKCLKIMGVCERVTKRGPLPSRCLVLLQSKIGLTPGVWLARAREPFALWRACWSRSAFSGRARCWIESTVVDLLLGGTGDGACPPRTAVFCGIRHCLTAGSCFGFSLFSLYIPMCLLWFTVCLFVIHKCSWAYLVSGVD
jgi:hypothetical protein